MPPSTYCLIAVVWVLLSGSSGAGDGLTLDNVAAPPPVTEDEPLAAGFSLERATHALDTTALHWQKTRRCAACHTMTPYLMARPLLAAVSPELPETRRFFETIVERSLEAEPGLPKDGVTAVVIEVAAALAFHDGATTGKLHPMTRRELERMWSLQRPDGGWEWPFRDSPPVKSDDDFGVAMAALAVGHAPENYAESPAARKGLEGIRRYLEAHPPTSLHQKAMLTWAGTKLPQLANIANRVQTVEELIGAQRPDGGWSTASLVENPLDPSRQSEEGRKARAEVGHGRDFLIFVGRDKVYTSSLDSDGYATGLVLYVLRQAGVSADDPRIRRGVAWLKTNQRASGRWFTPSQAWHTQNLLANAGTAYAILALHACGEIPMSTTKAKAGN